MPVLRPFRSKQDRRRGGLLSFLLSFAERALAMLQLEQAGNLSEARVRQPLCC